MMSQPNKPRWPRVAPHFADYRAGTPRASTSPPPPPPPPAASVRNVTSGQAGSATLPTRQSGDKLLVAFFSNSAMPAAQSGWTRVVNLNLGTTSLGVYSKTSDGTDSTAPIGGGVLSDFSTSFVCLSIQNPATQVVGATATTLTAPSVTAAAAGVLVSMFVAYEPFNTPPTITKPAGQTLAASLAWAMISGAMMTVSYETLAAAGATGTRAATPGGTYTEIGSVSIAG